MSQWYKITAILLVVIGALGINWLVSYFMTPEGNVQPEIIESSKISYQKRQVFQFDNGVSLSNDFAGSRLINANQKGDTIQAIIGPENTPVNNSPWFAFGLWAKSPKEVIVSLKYLHHKHRYIPKLSSDKVNWRSLTASQVYLNQDSTVASFKINLESDTLWVAAQELYSSREGQIWSKWAVSSIDGLNKEVAGSSVQGKDIEVLSYEHHDIKPSVVLIARQHPPEVPGGTIAFRSFFTTVFDSSIVSQEFRKNFNVYTFPLLNPDGADEGHWRHNANGVDLNRDWIDFSQPETMSVREFIRIKEEEGKKVVFGLDFHTSYSGPYLLILDSLNEQNMESKIIPNWIRNIDQSDPLVMDVEYKRRDQNLPYCYNWFFRELKAEAVTYEDGDEIDRKIIKKRASLFANKLMETLNQELIQ